MPKRGDLEVFRLLVIFLRSYAEMSQSELAAASRVSQPNISLYEKGEREPTEATLRRLAKGAGVEWTLVVQVRRFIEAFLSAVSKRLAASLGEPLDVAVLAPAVLAVIPYLVEDRADPPPRQTAEEERREAEEIWTALERFPIPRRRRLIEYTLRASKSAALAMRICEASAQAVDHDAREALELAFSIAERVEGEESGRVQAYCRERLVHARRVADGFAGAG
jgi:transcriptional regulator with XRE-family HTH domain